MVELKKILNKRTYLMGFACILIMIFHSDLATLNENIVKLHLYIGVDIFLFLSGIGIAQSLNNNKEIKNFYKKRLDKILTVSLPLIIIIAFLMYAFADNYGIKEFYYQTTLSNFLLSKGNYSLFLWYIPAILIYYLISPTIFKFYTTKENKIKSIITLLIICLMLIIFTTPYGFFSHYQIMTNRLPIYIIGLIYGVRIINNEKMTIWELICWSILALIGIIIIYLTTKYYSVFNGTLKILSFIPIVIISSILLSNLIGKIEKKVKFLNVIGKYTLGIYVTHEALIYSGKGFIKKYNITNSLIVNPYIFALIAIVLSIIIAIIWTKFINYIKDNKSKEI